jgi:YD repeat-containing protein
MSIFSTSSKALSMVMTLILSIACILPANAQTFVSISPLSYSAQSLLENAQAGAGLNGSKMEYAMMPTTTWTTLLAHLPTGNLVVRAELFNIPGAGIPLIFGLSYNSFHKDINLGLGKGWMSDLQTSAVRDPLTNTIRYVSPTGALLEFPYSPAQDKYLNPMGFSGQAIYHSNGNISIMDLNLQTQIFNAQGQLIEVKKCSGGSYTVSYNTNGQAISMNDPISQRSIELEWNSSGMLESVIDPMEHEWKLSYSQDFQQLVSLQQPEIPETEVAKSLFEYNSQAFLTKQTTFQGYEISLAYYSSGFASGKISAWSDANAHTTTFTYSDNITNYANKTTLTNAENQSTHYYIGSNSGNIERIQQIIDQENIESTYNYDNFGWLSSVTDPQGGIYLISRNASGKITSIVYPPAFAGQASFSEEWIYDQASIEGKLIQQREKLTSTLWASTYYFYEDQDAPCLPSKMVKADGVVELFDYNSQGQKLSHVLDPTGMNRVSQFSYAQNGNLTLMIDPEGNDRSYQYNANGFRVLEFVYQGSSSLGQIQKSISTDPNFHGSPSKITDNINNTSTSHVWAADGLLLCKLEEDQCGDICYEYKTSTSANNQAPILSIYHPRPWSGGELERNPKQPGLLDPIPPFTPPPTKITYNDSEIMLYTYNKTAQLTELINPLGQNSTYSYDALGRIISTQNYDGKNTEYTYDKLNQVLSKTISGEGTWTYHRDALGRILALDHPSKGLIQYAYSLRGDLLSDEKGTYSYDIIGRKVSAQYTGGGTDQWTYRADHEISSINGIPQEYNQMRLQTKWSDGTNQALIQYRSSVGVPTAITGSGQHGSYSFQFDSLHRMTQAQDTSKQIGSFQYQWNNENRLQTLSSPGQIVQENYYTTNQLTQRTLKKGSNTLYSANAYLNDKLQLSSLAYNQAPSYQDTLSYTYDTLQRLQSKQRSSDNQSVSYSYHPDHGKISSIQFSDQGTYTLAYNTQGFIQNVSYPDMSSETYNYNSKGLLESISLPANKSLSFSWDSKNRISQISSTEQQNQSNYSFNFNAIGKLSGISKSLQGFTVENWQFVNGFKGMEYATRTSMGFQDLSLDFSRDLLGRVTSISYHQLGGYNGELIPHFDYFGNLAQVTDLNGNLLASFQYDINHQIRTQEWNPQQLQLPFQGSAFNFSINNLFNTNLPTITLPDHNGKIVLGASWGVIGVDYEILSNADYENDITWDCNCGDWKQGKGKISKEDREEIKRRLRKRGYKEEELDAAIDQMEKEINNCCNEAKKGKNDQGKELIGKEATLRFADDLGDHNDWLMWCDRGL